METDLIFNRGIDLPGFASHPLVDMGEGREVLGGYLDEQIVIAAEHGSGLVLESPTWMANRDRGAAIGSDPRALDRRNREAVALMAEVRDERGHGPVVLSANVGPRSDPYASAGRMGAAAIAARKRSSDGGSCPTPSGTAAGPPQPGR